MYHSYTSKLISMLGTTTNLLKRDKISYKDLYCIHGKLIRSITINETVAYM